jgi:prepilin-type N-terminal cleavage/methylation domain-containing protein
MKLRNNDSASAGFTLIEVIVTLVVVAIVAAMMASYYGTSITQSSLPIFRLKAAARLNDVLEKITGQYSQYPYWQKSTTYAAGAVIVPTTPNRTGLLYTTTSGGTSGTTEPSWSTAITMGSTVTSGADGTIAAWSTVWDSTHNTAANNGAALTLVLKSWAASTLYALNAIVYPGNGFQYICTTAGTSGTAAPIWPTVSGGTVTEATGTGVKWQYIGYAPTVVLLTAIGTPGTNYTNTFGSYRLIDNKFIKFNTTVSPATEVDLTGSTTDLDYGKYLKVTIGFRSDDSTGTGETLTTLFVLR